MIKIKILFPLVLIAFAIFSRAQNGLEGIIVEKFYVSDANDTSVNSIGGVLPIGSVTYRIYVDMLPGYKFQAAYGVDQVPVGGAPSPGDHELRIETTTLFFNNEDRGATTPTFTKSRLSDNTVMLDSYLSVGAACAGHFGILKTEDDGVATVVNYDGVLQNNDPAAGIPLTVQDGIIAGSPSTVTDVGITTEIEVFADQNDGTNGPVFSTWNGSWACLTGCMGPDTVENKLLIAQITTDGVLTFELNIQIGLPGGSTQFERYVAKNPVGNEISIPSLTGRFGQNVSPTVTITAPSNGATFQVDDNVTIEATAGDTDGSVTQVEFFVDGNSVGADSTSPYNASWTAAAGVHSLTAVATDNEGAETTSSAVSITVGNNLQAPTVSIIAPANGATYIEGESVNIQATAADADGTVTKVEFFVNGTSIGTDNSSPFSKTWNSVQGTASLTARATDNDGLEATSPAVTITVSDSVTGIKDLSFIGMSFIVFPNPASSSVTMEIEAESQSRLITYTLYMLSGEAVFKKELGIISGKHAEVIDLSSLASGHYFIEVSSEGHSSIKKITKN